MSSNESRGFGPPVVARPIAGCLLALLAGVPLLIAAALIPRSLEQAVLATAGVVITVTAVLALMLLGAGHLLHLDHRADDVTSQGRARALLPGFRPPANHWVKPRPRPEGATTPAESPSQPAVESQPAAVDLRATTEPAASTYAKVGAGRD